MGKKSKRNRRLERATSRQSVSLSGPWVTFGASALIVVVCLVVYHGSLRFGLTGLDDDMFMSTFAKKQYSVADALHRDAFMAEKSDNFYRPLQSIAFIASVHFWDWGNHPFSYHRTSVILHCITACCLLQLLLLLGYSQALSFFATLIYAVHPLFAQAVAWIPGCGDLLLGLFGILSFWTLVKFCKARKPYLLLMHFLAFALAALSKETALVLPGLFAVYLITIERKKTWSLKNLPLAAIWTVVVAAYFLLRRTAIHSFPKSGDFGFAPLMQNLRVLPETLGSFIIPIKISVLPSFSLRLTIIGLIALAAIVAVIWLQGKHRKPLVLIGCLWFILLSIPGMMYSQKFGKNAYNYLNHRAYLPMVGILLVLVEAVPERWLARRKKEFYWIGGGVGVLLCILAYHQSNNFIDSETFYSQAIRTNPQSALAYNHRGKFRADAREYRDALSDYDEALRLFPNYPLAYNNRAETKGILGDTQGAIDDLTHALALEPDNAVMYSNRGRWKDQLGDHAGALADYNRGIQLDPDFAGNFNNRGALRAKSNNLDGAEADFLKAVQLDPKMGDSRFNLAQVRIQRGDKDGACKELLAAAQLQNARASQMFEQLCR
jgi:tetratricopeptide (TPR) repeat protein